ncbi:MAG: hypothetical protein QOI54_1216 [Actinomycetota bacterium]|nr:hypothetical protein [Actinomycetota bacterium]
MLLSERARYGRISLPSFYLGRAARLLPALAVAGAVTVAVLGVGKPLTIAVWSVVGPATFTTNWLVLHGKPVWWTGWAWSLSIEEQFYLAWAPLLTLFVWRRRLRPLLPVVIAVGIAAALACHPWWAMQNQRDLAYFSTRSRADALLIGSGVAYWAQFGTVRCPRWLVSLGVLGLVAAWLWCDGTAAGRRRCARRQVEG